MRIGLYGMPTSGKSYILDQIDFLEVLAGSKLLREYDPDFDKQDEAGREADRKAVANICKQKDMFIMDGHYAFGDEVAFTDEEGEMYDRYLYLYIEPNELKRRMELSEKNQKYLKYDLASWQKKEIDGLRSYCHEHNKDFYVIDNPPQNMYVNAEDVICFLKDIVAGYSNVGFSVKICEEILRNSTSDEIVLADGDRTYICEDSSSFVFNYKTNIFDGNFYSGFQSWRQHREFETYDINIPEHIGVNKNPKLPQKFGGEVYILSSGNRDIWDKISEQTGLQVFTGNEMSAETKFYVAKFLRNEGRYVIAYGDSMSDLYMIQEADDGYLVSKSDGSLSRSLVGVDLGGVKVV